MSKRVQIAEAGPEGNAVISPVDLQTVPWWTVHVISDAETANKVGSEIVAVLNSHEAMKKALELAVTLFEDDDECQKPGTDAYSWRYEAEEALRLASEE